MTPIRLGFVVLSLTSAVGCGIIGAPERADRVAGPAGKVVGAPRNSTGTSPGR